jgi:hypothetical protein
MQSDPDLLGAGVQGVFFTQRLVKPGLKGLRLFSSVGNLWWLGA